MDVPFLSLPSMDDETRLKIVCQVVDELVTVDMQIGDLEAQETRAKLDGYSQAAAAGLTDSASRKQGDIQAREISATLCELRGLQQALTEAKWLIFKLVDHARG